MFPGRDELHACTVASPQTSGRKLTGRADFFSVADRYDILPHCQFKAMCLSLVWDDRRLLWICTFHDTISGEVYKREAPVVVSPIFLTLRDLSLSKERSWTAQDGTTPFKAKT